MKFFTGSLADGVLADAILILPRPLIYICVCRFVCPPYVIMRRRNYVAQTRACSKSVLGS